MQDGGGPQNLPQHCSLILLRRICCLALCKAAGNDASQVWVRVQNNPEAEKLEKLKNDFQHDIFPVAASPDGSHEGV